MRRLAATALAVLTLAALSACNPLSRDNPQPAATAAASPTVRTADATGTLLTASGHGNAVLPAFRATNQWVAEWTYRGCDALGLFVVGDVPADGSGGEVLVHEDSPTGSDDWGPGEAGVFTLTVTSYCSWHLRVYQA